MTSINLSHPTVLNSHGHSNRTVEQHVVFSISAIRTKPGTSAVHYKAFEAKQRG